MDANMINIILLIVLGFFSIFGFFFGFIRGLWKTTFRTIWLIGTVVLALVLAPVLTNAILDFPINASISIEELNINTITTIRDTIHIVLDNLIAPNLTVDYPGLTEIIVSIPSIILNIVLFILLFFVLKLVLLPISAIIYNLCTGHNKKPATTVVTTKNGKKTSKKEVAKPVKKSKHRFVGAIVGLSTGVVVSFSILMPISAATNMITKHNLAATLDDIAGTPVVSEYLDAYNQSFVGQMYKYTGLSMVADLAFDSLTTIKVDSTHNIKLTTDLPVAITSYGKVTAIMEKINEYMGEEFDYKRLTKAQATELLDDATALLNDLSSITTLSSLNDYIIPVMIDYLDYKEIKLNEDSDINTAMYNTLASLGNAVKNGTNINVFTELKSIVEIAKYLNNNGILLPLLQDDKANLGQNILALEDDFSATLSNKLFALETVNVTAPNLINVGLLALSKTFDIDYDSTHLATSTEIKNTIGNIIGDVLDIYTTLDFDSAQIYTDDTFASVGRLLDTVKNSSILDTDTYNSLVEFGIGYMSTMLSDSIPEEYGDLFDKIFEVLPNNIIGISSWESELAIVQDSFEILTGENGLLTESFDPSNAEHLTNLGKVLDTLATTKLLSGKVALSYVENSTNKQASKPFIEYILFHAMDSLRPMLEGDIGSTYGELLDVLDDVKLNIANSTYDPATQTKYWEDEFKKLAPTMNILLSTMDGGEIGLDATTGEALDTLRTSVLFGENVTTDLFGKVLDLVKDTIDFGDETISNTIKDVLSDVSNRLKSNTLKEFIKNDPTFWETEMTHIETLMEIEFNGSDAVESLTTTGATIDKIVKGDITQLLRPSALLQADDFRKIIATSIGTMSSTLLSSLDPASVAYTAVNNAITSITKNYYHESDETYKNITISSFEDELTHLANMKDVDPNVFSSDTSSKAEALGEMLDSIAYNDDTNNNSDTITKDIINKIIVDCLPMINDHTSHDYVNEAVASIKTNITAVYNKTVSISGWTEELVHLYNIANLDGDLFDTLDSFDNTKATTIGNRLDNIVYNYHANIKDTSKNSVIITDTIINTLVTKMLNEVKYTSTPLTETEKLTNKILTNAADTSVLDYANQKADAYTYTNVLQDLAYIKGQVDGITDVLDSPALSTLTEETAIKIDQTLENIQARKICGAVIAREVALKIITDITTETYRNSYAPYAKALFDHYTANADSTTNESYYDSADTSKYDDATKTYVNGFQKLYHEYQVVKPSL